VAGAELTRLLKLAPFLPHTDNLRRSFEDAVDDGTADVAEWERRHPEALPAAELLKEQTESES
jgi:hypothetical protein